MNREEINKAYQELLIKISKIEDIVKRHKFDYKLSFYNGHYYKDSDNYRYEFYPIPVIEVKDRFDILVDFDTISVDGILNKEYSLLKECNCYFEIYDPNDYLKTLCTSNDSSKEINTVLKSYKDKELKISIEIKDLKIEEIIELIKHSK